MSKFPSPKILLLFILLIFVPETSLSCFVSTSDVKAIVPFFPAGNSNLFAPRTTWTSDSVDSSFKRPLATSSKSSLGLLYLY